jgi:hypothetical protein
MRSLLSFTHYQHKVLNHFLAKMNHSSNNHFITKVQLKKAYIFSTFYAFQVIAQQKTFFKR